MKRLILFISVILTSCGANQTDNQQKADTPPSPTINRDSLKRVKQTIHFHWEKYKDIYTRLQIDSLRVDSMESYRVVIGHSWGYNQYGGQPTSITFHKNADTCYVVILDLYSGTAKSVIHKSVKFIPTNYFDSIKVMFDKGTFWQHSLTTINGDRIGTDPDYVFFEAVKKGKHKLVSQLHEIENTPILNNWKYNFYHFSYYNKLFDKDFEFAKKHPPGGHK